MRLRSVYHTSEGEGMLSVGRWIIGWTWLLAIFYNWEAFKYNFSHEELWEPEVTIVVDGKPQGVFFSEDTGQPVGQCFSSTTRGDSKGVRFAPASEVLKHPERWRYIEFEVDDGLWAEVKVEMDKTVGNKYDFVAVTTGFITPIMIDPADRHYCSGICCWVKFLLCILNRWWKRVSPRRSAALLVPHWGEPKAV